MNNFKINLREDSLYINNSGSVIGVIYFSVNNWYFPSKGWDDFVVILLAWLAKQTIELNFDEKKKVEMCFMEGCFKISLSLSGENCCTINFIEGEALAGDQEVIHNTIDIPFKDLKSEVKNACKTLLKMKESKALDFEDDYEDLKISYDLLCKL